MFGEIVANGKKIEPCFNHLTHKYLYYIFSIRPIKEENADPFATNPLYCIYDEMHNDYSFTKKWNEFVINFLTNKKMTLSELKDHFDKREKIDITTFI